MKTKTRKYDMMKETEKRYIDDVCERFLPEYEYRTTEAHTTMVEQWLDQCAGVDILCKKGNSIVGVASRVQFDFFYSTFTIRVDTYTGYETELKKRLNSIEHDTLYPKYTIQAYYIDDEFSHGAMIKTKDLYDFILKNREILYTKEANDEYGNKQKFLCVEFHLLDVIDSFQHQGAWYPRKTRLIL